MNAEDQKLERITLKAGTVLHRGGMPLELAEDTEVLMHPANKALADEFEIGTRVCHAAADGRPGRATACG